MATYSIRPRRATAAQWTSANTTLALAEEGYETDTRKTKHGDGTTPWNALLYDYDEVGTGGGGVASVNGDAGPAVVLTQSEIASDATAKQFLAADQTKLNGLTGLPAGGTDGQYLGRSSGAPAWVPRTRTNSIAYATTVTPNVDTTDVLNVGALTGSLTLANPTGTPIDGQTLRVRLAQDAAGSRSMSFGSAYAFGTDITTALIPSSSLAKWEMLFGWHTVDSKWRALSIARGF
jgi:hypothetical protein